MLKTMVNQGGDDSSLLGTNGFMFKRKCQGNLVGLPTQKVKRNSYQPVDDKQIKICLKNPPTPQESKQKAYIETRSRRSTSTSRRNQDIQEINYNEKESPSKKISVKSKKAEQEGKAVNKNIEPEKEIILKKAKPEVPAFKEKEIVPLPQYPVLLLPVEFDREAYETENPYKRLSKMVVDICSNEKNMLNIEFKDYSFYLQMVEKFVQKLVNDVDAKLDPSIRHSSSVKVLKEHPQNVYERQKKKVIEGLRQEEYNKNKILMQFEESLLTQGKASNIIETFLKYTKHDNKLILDSVLSKQIENQKEEIEKQVNQKIKSSLQGLNSCDKSITTFHKEIDAVAFKLEKTKQAAFSKIFKEYIPTFEANPSDLMKNFLDI